MDPETLGLSLQNLISQQAKWSQATFGSDRQKGPIGCLKHLEKEAVEAQKTPYDASEYADCLLLLLDASRRAGFSIDDLLGAAHRKQATNALRDYGRAPVYKVISSVMRAGTQPPYVCWLSAGCGHDRVDGHGFTEEEAEANAWANVRRLFDNPVEHDRKII